MDVRNPAAVTAAVDQALKEFGKIDILVNCECQALLRGSAGPDGEGIVDAASYSPHSASEGEAQIANSFWSVQLGLSPVRSSLHPESPLR